MTRTELRTALLGLLIAWPPAIPDHIDPVLATLTLVAERVLLLFAVLAVDDEDQ